ncbi:MAG: hypothetical protein ABIA97_04185 [Candidatus Omnitrophota bacterium]
MSGEIIYNTMILMKNNKGQITSEYAILIILIIGALAAMQIYLKRAVQGRLKDAMDYSVNAGVFNTLQFSANFVDSNRTDERIYDIDEGMDYGLAISRETIENLSSNITSVIGNRL